MAEPNEEEEHTGQLIDALANDIDRCHAGLLAAIDAGQTDSEGNVDADYEFHARQLVRSILAFIEGVTFSAKITAIVTCTDMGIEVTDLERLVAVEVDYDLNDKGEVVERPAKLSLVNNLRFAFRLLERSQNRGQTFDPSSEWWACLRSTIRVRDRLTHPRLPKDLEITGTEIVNAIKARNGFTNMLRKIHEGREPPRDQ
jgi:hypothetical protein